MIYKAVNLQAWGAAESTLGLPGENRRGGKEGDDVIYGDDDTSFSS